MKTKFAMTAISSLILTACGGGGDTKPTLQPQATPSGQLEKAAYAAYAEPAGKLCEKKETAPAIGQYCIEPTSSSMSLTDLQKTLLDPNGPLVHFSMRGPELHTEIVSRSATEITGDSDPETQDTAPTDATGVPSFQGVSRKDAYVGKGRILMDAYTYGNPRVLDKEFSPNTYSFDAPSDKNTSNITTLNFDGGLTGPLFTRAHLSTIPALDGGPIPSKFIHDDWWASIGLLTDWSDAPAETTLTYEGSVTVTAWDPDHDSTASCDVTVTVDILSKSVTMKPVKCTEEGVSVAFEGPLTFTVEGSRITPQVKAAPVTLSVINAKNNIKVSADPVTELTGGIFGSQAATIEIQGWSRKASFGVIGIRAKAH